MVEAAANNANWCDAVCCAIGRQTRWTDHAWTVAERSPGGYPDAVAVSPDAEIAAVLRRVQGGRGCSIKDSFAALDLPLGFQVLFEATWIRRAAAEARWATTLDWASRTDSGGSPTVVRGSRTRRVRTCPTGQ